MAYDESLALRIRSLLKRRRGISERKMFGGIAFLLDGKMCCGVLDSDLVARLGPDASTGALKRAHVRPMDFTGKPLKGFLYVGEAAIRSDKQLREWVGRCATFARSLPAKPVARKTARQTTR